MLNTITICGRMTTDPTLRYTQTQKPVASFTLAVDRDGRNAETDFIDCVAWNNTANFVNSYFSKGSSAIVTGRLQIREYTDKSGNKRTAAEVVANSVYFAGDKKKDNAPAQFEEISDSEELPF